MPIFHKTKHPGLLYISAQSSEKLNPDIIGLQWKGRSPGTGLLHPHVNDIATRGGGAIDECTSFYIHSEGR